MSLTALIYSCKIALIITCGLAAVSGGGRLGLISHTELAGVAGLRRLARLGGAGSSFPALRGPCSAIGINFIIIFFF